MSPKRYLKYLQVAGGSSLSFFSNKKVFIHDLVFSMLKTLENADRDLAADIENDLVKLASRAVNPLIMSLEHENNQVRKHVAMSLIRIGTEVIDPLRAYYTGRQDLNWMINFIMSEITCTQNNSANNSFYELIAS